MHRAAFWMLALIGFPVSSVVFLFASGSFAVLFLVPAMLTFIAGYGFRRRSLEIGTAMVLSAIAGFAAWIAWIAVAIVFFDAKPFD